MQDYDFTLQESTSTPEMDPFQVQWYANPMEYTQDYSTQMYSVPISFSTQDPPVFESLAPAVEKTDMENKAFRKTKSTTKKWTVDETFDLLKIMDKEGGKLSKATSNVNRVRLEKYLSFVPRF